MRRASLSVLVAASSSVLSLLVTLAFSQRSWDSVVPTDYVRAGAIGLLSAIIVVLQRPAAGIAAGGLLSLGAAYIASHALAPVMALTVLAVMALPFVPYGLAKALAVLLGLWSVFSTNATVPETLVVAIAFLFGCIAARWSGDIITAFLHPMTPLLKHARLLASFAVMYVLAALVLGMLSFVVHTSLLSGRSPATRLDLPDHLLASAALLAVGEPLITPTTTPERAVVVLQMSLSVFLMVFYLILLAEIISPRR